jgi:cob(I)alamin adenosyltransferase
MDLPPLNDLFDNQEELGEEHYTASLQDAVDEFNESVILTKFSLTQIKHTGILLDLATIRVLERIIVMISRNELPYTHQEININMEAKIRSLERTIARLRSAVLPRLREAKAAINLNSDMMTGVGFW